MGKNENACLVCGKPLIYFTKPKLMKCHFCLREFPSYACCEDGHFICDDCHSIKGIDAIITYCMETGSTDPVRIAQSIMEDPFIYMHGPEHHTMVGAALLTAYKNAGGEIDLEEALTEMHERGKQYPGGSCGFWGCCGAAVSVGMFISIITDTTPLSSKTWGWSNEATSRALAKIASYGGPRCCKRNSFTAILAAVELVSEKTGIDMHVPERIRCTFSDENHECLGKRCPYNTNNQNGTAANPTVNRRSIMAIKKGNIKSIDHLVITTAELEACLYFYEGLLGMEHRVEGGQHTLHFGDQKINLHTRPHEFHPSATNVTHGSQDFCFIADGDIYGIKKELTEAGIEIIEGVVERNGARGLMDSIYMYDPDGNLVEIAVYRSEEKVRQG